ncbi:MAG TPA: hypothetical protein VGO93_04960 [Candidatus Xenobia bacterium]|jgi:hypothetical protein
MRTWILLLSLALPACAQGSGADAVITNSGSTNMPGFSITVRSDGWATRQPARGTRMERKVLLPVELSNRLFSDLATAAPMSKYPPVRCMKSASFGFTETVRYNGATSPDLACPNTDARLSLVVKDVQAVVQAFQKTP